MKEKVWILGIVFLLFASWAGAAELPTGTSGSSVVSLENTDIQTEYNLSVFDASETVKSEDELIAALNKEGILLSGSCGAQCGSDYCICAGDEACCDDVCEWGCSLCGTLFDYPCYATGEGD